MECHSCPVSKIVQAFAEADLEKSMGRCQSKRLKEACAKLQESMQNVCLTCVNEVNDNNPSNHGQIFYSLDSGHCQSNSGKSRTSHSDDNEVISRADWINSNASYDSPYYQDNQFRPYSGDSPLDPAIAAIKSEMSEQESTEIRRSKGDTVTYSSVTMPSPSATAERDRRFFGNGDDGKAANPFLDEFSLTNLPSEIESIMLSEMNNFAGLPMLAKLLICCLLEGKNLSDFARLTWLPKGWISKEARKESPISPQTAHALFFNICKKLPHFAVLARATKKRSKARIENQNEAIRKYQKKTDERIGYLKDPSTVHRKPKENPHARNETPDNQTERKRSKQEKPRKKSGIDETMEFVF